MKNLFSSFFALALASTPIIAQQMTPDQEELSEQEKYERITEAKIKLDIRAQTIRTLELTTKETEKFTPIFLEYQKYQDQLEDRLDRVVNEYQEEAAEQNGMKSAENERADFIEDYWEVKIAELELKKDYFDRLEDEIGADRALKFFAMEDMYRSRAIRARIAEYIPALIVIEPVNLSYQFELDEFNNWNRINLHGSVGLDHEFTSEGLEKLVKLTSAMANFEGVSVDNLPEKRAMILDKAEKITRNWQSFDHADDVRAAFEAMANIIDDIASDDRFITRKAWIETLYKSAAAINVDKNLTDQAEHVYKFFSAAETIVNDLISQANGTVRSRTYDMRK
jgi:hypothetical protein